MEVAPVPLAVRPRHPYVERTITYRNDHDAALSRIAALERALDTASAQASRDEDTIAALERELRAHREHGGRAHVATAQPVRAPAIPRERPRIDELDLAQRGPAISRAVLVALLVLAGGAAGAGYWAIVADADEPVRAVVPCAVETRGAPASLYALDELGGREIYLGETPVTLTRETWATFDAQRLELRREGYDALQIPVPFFDNGCDPKHWTLFPR